MISQFLATLLATLMALGLLSLLACSDSPTEPGGAPEPITELPRALSATEVELLDAGNRFGFDLLAEMAPKHAHENLFFSPLSASMALGMTLNGADGETYAEMRDMLGFEGMDQEEINQAYATLLELLQGLDPQVTVEIANSVWYREGVGVDAGFLQRIRTSFEAEADGVDFSDPATLDRINGWVDDQTRGTIPTLLDQVPAGLVMFLANAVYFNGDWTDAFDPDQTTTGSFTRADGSTVDADFMRKERTEVGFREVEGHQVVELPYGGQAFAMTVVLPAQGTAASEVAAGLDVETWASWTDGLPTREVALHLPKFELDWVRRLNDDLQGLGMRDAFDAGAADFSRMVPGGGVWVDFVLQKSFVRVDEVGTEASAATGVAVVESAPPLVRADRPFVFAIRERLTGSVLFLGVVDDPS